MAHTTVAHLNSIIEDINGLQPHADGKYYLDSAYGGYRLGYEKTSGGAYDCSERVSAGELYRICFAVRNVLERNHK